MKYIAYLVALLISGPVLGQDNLDSLFRVSDFAVKGKLVEHTFSCMHDLGTEHHDITLKVDKVYKFNRQVEKDGNIYFSTILSNMFYPDGTIDALFKPFEEKSHIFFLKDTAFTMSGQDWQEIGKVPVSAEIDEQLKKLAEKERWLIEHIGYKKTCDQNCPFCKTVTDKNWNRVESQLRAYINNHQKEGVSAWEEWLLTHRQVEYVLQPQAILASIPSWGTWGIRFKVRDTVMDAAASFRFGAVHSLFGLTLKIDEDKTTMTGFELRPEYTDQFIDDLKWAWEATITDTNRPVPYPLMEAPDSWYLYAYLDGWTGYAFNLHPSVEYLWLETLSKLKDERAVYHLCLASQHFHPAIRYESLRALGELNDKRCTPYLIQLAQFNSKLDISTYNDTLQGELNNYFQILSETLNDLTGCQVEIMRINTSEQDRLRMGIPVWQSKIKTVAPF